MTQISLDRTLGAVVLQSEQNTAVYPYLWLRDNCPSGLHPDTKERTFDLLSVPEDIHPSDCALIDSELVVTWALDGHVSRFSLDWLEQYQPGRLNHDAARIPATHWLKGANAPVAPATADDLLDDDAALLNWLTETKRTGLGLVSGLADEQAGMAVANRIGFLRRTNFGKTFEVVSKPDPNNLAYTSIHLPLHTDLPNQEMPPGFQFLHCLANEAEGGGSVFCDGFAMAEELRRIDPDAFEVLSTTYVPMRFHDQDYDLGTHQTVIRTDPFGAIVELRFNAHLAGILDIAPENMAAYYRAYRQLMKLIRNPDHHFEIKLQAGQMAVFDNRRVLHGRQAFDPQTGRRHFRGCYVDRGEWDSKIRVLSRANKETA